MSILRVDTIAGLGQTFGPNFNGDLEFNSQNFIVLPKGSSNQQGVLRTTEDVIGVGGTHYDNLVLALPLNEATQFKDVSSRGRNPGTYGNVSISSTISKYYGSSAKFDGTGDYLITNSGISSDFVFESDFTVEGWIYSSSSGGNKIIIDTRPTGATSPGWVIYLASDILTFYYSATILTSASTISTNAWNHFAFVRNGSNFKLYVNGVESDSDTSTTVYDYTEFYVGYKSYTS